jgi:hypothetical protein
MEIRLFPCYKFKRQYRGNQKYNILRVVVLNQIKKTKLRKLRKIRNKK